MTNEIISTLETKIDALIAYTHTLEHRNALLEQELDQSEKRTLTFEAQKATLCEQLMTLAASLET